MTDDRQLNPATLIAQALREIDRESGAVIPPLHLSTTFARDEHYDLPRGFEYRRGEGPTVNTAERVLAALEDASHALLFSSGLAAMSAFIETLKPGAHVAAPKRMYYGGRALLERSASLGRIRLTQFDQTEPGALEKALGHSETALVWIETPANPTWDVIDIAAAAHLAHDAGALLAVDGTTAPPCTTRALDLGADLVFHSATKYLNGHSDVLAGVLAGREAAIDWADLMKVRELTGSILSPFDAWLLLRGVRTLFVRFDHASRSAMKLAAYFQKHPALENVLYPGLASHPGYEIAARQMTGGFGGMLSVLINGGYEEARRIAGAVKVFVPATSLGGVESLIEHRKSIEGPASPIPDNLLRLSVGLEAPEDLIADLENAIGAG